MTDNYGVLNTGGGTVNVSGSAIGVSRGGRRRGPTGAPNEQWTNDEGLLCTRIGNSAIVNIGQSGLSTGDPVRHRNRGLGTFLHYDGRDEACVDFGDGGSRVTSALLEAAS
jgi:hypothetical protein